VAASNMATPEEKEAFVDLVEHGFIQGPRLTPAGWAALRAVDDDEQVGLTPRLFE
jgi:hypothetical protein